MDSPLTVIASRARIRDNGPDGKEGQAVSGVREAPLQPVWFATLGNVGPEQVADSLAGLTYLKEFNTTATINKQEFIKKVLLGSTLLTTGYNFHNLLNGLSVEKPLLICQIIDNIYYDAGIFSSLFTQTIVLTITWYLVLKSGSKCRKTLEAQIIGLTNIY